MSFQQPYSQRGLSLFQAIPPPRFMPMAVRHLIYCSLLRAPAGAVERAAVRAVEWTLGAPAWAAAQEAEWILDAPAQESREPYLQGQKWAVESPVPEWVGIRACQVEWVAEALAQEWVPEKAGARVRSAERADRVPEGLAHPGLRAGAGHPEWVVAELVRPVGPEAEASSESPRGLGSVISCAEPSRGFPTSPRICA